MKSIFKVILAAFVMSLMLSSCSNKTTEVNYYENDILPLRIGNSWSYIDSTYDGKNFKIEQSQIKVTDLNSINLYGKTYKYFTLTEYSQQNKQMRRVFMSNEPDGLYNYGSKDEPQNMSFRHIYLKYPVEQNSSWTTIYHDFNDVIYHFQDDTASAKCVTKSEIITVPAGSFNCIKYQYIFEGNIKVEEYWSVGIGQISSSMYYQDQLIFRRVLKSKAFM